MASFSFKDSTGKWVPIVSGGGSGLAQLTETLTVENWDGSNQQTLSIDDIDEDSVIIVGASNNDIDIYNSCEIRAISQGDKTLTFSCKTLPESAIEIIVLYGPSTVVAPSPTPTPTPEQDGKVQSVDGINANDDGNVVLNAVRYTSQTLTDEQQQQARTNIGAGTAGSVDAVSPNADGDVILSAVRYVAQTLEDAQKVQARKNIGVDGQVYTCTAQALEAMSQEQQAELYVQGYRAIKTENNGTVVLLGLASDGSLEWLGCNQPRGSLLDNGDFAIAQAGYGGLHGAQKYACDRWFTDNSATINHSGGVLTFDAAIQQRVSTTLSSHITIAVCMGDGTIRVAAGDSSGNVVGTGFYYDAAGNTFIVQPSIGSLKWAALYAGSYTAKTLPPWEEPDYAAELQKCQYFYGEDILNCWLPVHNQSLNAYALLVTYPTMRVAPTIELTASDGVIASVVYQSALMLYVTGVENPVVNGIKRIADL